jgi:hypothetical protein
MAIKDSDNSDAYIGALGYDVDYQPSGVKEGDSVTIHGFIDGSIVEDGYISSIPEPTSYHFQAKKAILVIYLDKDRQ